MTHRLSAILIVGIILGSATGCSKKIEGVVRDPFGQAIPGARVQIENTQFLASTDKDGRYALDYMPGQLTILFSKDGYVPESRQISITERAKIPFEDLLLYPVPGAKGLFIVGESGYVEMESFDIDRKARTNFWGYGKVTYGVPSWALDSAPIVFSGKLKFVDRNSEKIVLAQLDDGVIRRATVDMGLENGQVEYDGFREDESRRIDSVSLTLRSVDLAPGDYAWIELLSGPFGTGVGKRSFPFRVRDSSAEHNGDVEVERVEVESETERSVTLDSRVVPGLPVTVSQDFRLMQGGRPISPPLLYEDKGAAKNVTLVSRSKSGSRLIVAVCDFDCDDLRVVDLASRTVRRFGIWKYTDLGWLSWSPSEKYIVLSSSHVESTVFYAYDISSLERFDLDYSLMVPAAGDKPQSKKESVKWVDNSKFYFSLPVQREGGSMRSYDVTVDLSAAKLHYKKVS